MEAEGHDIPSLPHPTDDPWDFQDPAEAARRFPRLSRLFPLDPAMRVQRIREGAERFFAEQGLTEEDSTAEPSDRGADQEPPGADVT
jgi:hypothetical protein